MGKKPIVVNMARSNKNCDYSPSITPVVYMASSIRATYHLCRVREWFIDFHYLESNAAMIENDQLYRTREI